MNAKPYSNYTGLDLRDSDADDLGPRSAGQSGDLQGLPDDDEESESVAELLEEGQYFEAAALSGIENAPPAGVSEVKTRQLPEDDVPAEYLENDEPSTR
jgi:hypothetical protein